MRKRTGIVLLLVCVLAASAMLTEAYLPAMSSANGSSPAVVGQVTKAMSTTTTDLGATTILEGQSVTDNATVMAGEGNDLNGSITFMVSYNGGPWTMYGSNVTVVNGSAISAWFMPPATGTYWFKANYSGNNDTLPSSSANGSEMLNVTAITPPVGNSTTMTWLGSSSIMLGQSVTDNATISAAPGSNLSGNVSFMVSYNGGPWKPYDVNVTLVNGSAVSAFYMPPIAGMYAFKANYSGNANLNPSSSMDGAEILNVTAITPPVGNSTTMTWLGSSSIMLGQSVTDNATISAAPGSNLSGTVTFMVSYNGGPWMMYGSNVTVVNGSAISAWFMPPATGTYSFKANYSGNANLNPSSSMDGAEMLNVTAITPPVGNSTTMTWLGAYSIQLGQSVTDNATISAAPGSNLSGTVTFMVSYNGGPWMFGTTVPLVNGSAISAWFMPQATGTYSFKANYSGNANLNPSSSMDGAEMLNVTAIPPPVCRCINVGEPVMDNATVTGMVGFPVPTGTVDFQVSFMNGTWMTFDPNVTLVNGNAMSTWYFPMAAGNYDFRAMYNGDSYYLRSVSGDTLEPLCVVQGQRMDTTTTTMLTASNFSLGHSVLDNATVMGTLLGSPVPTGNVDFQVSYNGGNWTAFDLMVPLTNGSATSAYYTPLAAGHYAFRAIYYGDSMFNVSMSGDRAELLLVSPGPTGGQNGSGVITHLSYSDIGLGMNVTDMVTVFGIGGDFPVPTGSVDFQVSFMNGTWMTFDANVPLVNGTAMSSVYMPTAPGNYTFRAVYSGDVNYLGATSGAENEALIVEKAMSTTVTNLGVCMLMA